MCMYTEAHDATQPRTRQTAAGHLQPEALAGKQLAVHGVIALAWPSVRNQGDQLRGLLARDAHMSYGPYYAKRTWILCRTLVGAITLCPSLIWPYNP